ncbi:CYTH domain-containing protein [Streptomyces californicus]
MPTETERKYLVSADDPRWRAEVRETRTLRQGYLSPDPACEIRIRVIDDTAAYLTVKGPRDGPTRAEYEYPVPVADALELLGLCGPRVLVKHRHTLPDDWIVDEYAPPHAGLAVAEIEWQGDPATPPPRPPWAGEDITGDRAYSNATLTTFPSP